MSRITQGPAGRLCLVLAMGWLTATAALAMTPAPVQDTEGPITPAAGDLLTTAGSGPSGLAPDVLKKRWDNRPNILLILADDLGYGDLGCFGSDYILTPVLDQLATEGVKLTDFSTNSAGCTPSRVSILTGTMATYHGFQSVNTNLTYRGIPDAVTTVAEILRDAGYNTGHVGKWHIGENLNEDTQEFLPPRIGFDWSARLFIPTQQTHWNPLVAVNEEYFEFHDGGHSTPVLTDYALDFLDEQADQDEPWFLNLWYFAPHLPMQVPASYLALYPDSEPTALWTKFAAMVSQMDEGIGQVLAKLDELGMANDTLILFFSDNGGSLSPGLHPDGMGGLKGGKGDFTDGGIRVPFIARWPGEIPAGTEVEAKVYASDILPTAQEIVGSTTVYPHVEGRSMLDTLRGNDPGSRSQNFYWSSKAGYNAPLPAHGIFETFAVRQDHTTLEGLDFKLIFTDQSKTELYDMDSDPAETSNLVDLYPGKTQKLWNAFWLTRGTESVLQFTPALHGEAFPLEDSVVFFNGLMDFPADAWFDFHNGHFTGRATLRVQKLGVEQVIMRKADSWELVLTATDEIQLTLIDEEGSPVVLTAPTPVTLGQNVEIAWTVVRWATPAKDNDIRLYVDGTVVATAEIPAVAPNRNDVQFGNDDVPPLGTRPFKGVISRIQFHNVALTQEELAGSIPPIPSEGG